MKLFVDFNLYKVKESLIKTKLSNLLSYFDFSVQIALPARVTETCSNLLHPRRQSLFETQFQIITSRKLRSRDMHGSKKSASKIAQVVERSLKNVKCENALKFPFIQVQNLCKIFQYVTGSFQIALIKELTCIV